MRTNLKYVVLLLVIMATTVNVGAQNAWPSPEVEQMYKQARDYLSAGDLQQAIVTYQQTIRLAPDQLVLFRDLGKAYYLAGDYKNAQNTLEQLLKSDQADPLSFQVMAACQTAAGEKKKAKATLQRGLDRFPNSGILYHDMGKAYEEDNEMVYALQTWLDGIHKDPAYHVNYYEAARVYLNSNKPIWGILYGEMFVNIERQTPRSEEIKGMLFNAYKKLFTSVETGDIPKFGSTRKDKKANNFEQAVYATYMNLAPVVSDGITAENLTMLRTRFAMAWSVTYAAQYPFSLFAYQDQMLRNGYFDIYNEWLFGKVDNAMEYGAWNSFHKGAIEQYETWEQQHSLHPETSDFYNDMKVEDIFAKHKG